MSKKGKGWHGEPNKHALAAMGIKTSNIPESKAEAIAKKDADNIIDLKETEEGKYVPDVDGATEEVDKDERDLTKDDDNILSNLKTGVGKLASKTKESLSNIQERLADKADEEIADIVEGDVKESVEQQLESEIGPRYSDTERRKIRQVIRKGDKKELLDLIREDRVIDARAIKITDKNANKLGAHLGNIKHDISLLEDKVRLLKDLKEEKYRHAKQKYKNIKEQLHEKWDEKKEDLEGTERKEEANKFNHLLEMKRIDLNQEVMVPEAKYKFAKEKKKALESIYKERKSFINKLLN